MNCLCKFFKVLAKIHVATDTVVAEDISNARAAEPHIRRALSAHQGPIVSSDCAYVTAVSFHVGTCRLTRGRLV